MLLGRQIHLSHAESKLILFPNRYRMQCANSRFPVRPLFSEWRPGTPERLSGPLQGTPARGTLLVNVAFSLQKTLRSSAPLVAALLVAISVMAQPGDKDSSQAVPLQAILSRPDHADFKWKVQYFGPGLMYQQQYLLLIRTLIPAEMMDAGGTHHVLHFLAKVQDSSGAWLPGEQYNRFEPTATLGKTKNVECSLAIYLRPGEYTVAMIAYESSSNRSNIVRNKVVVRPPPGDPIPDLDSHLPAAEFPVDFPQGDFSDVARSSELFAIGHQLSPLVVPAPDRVRIDLVLNIAKQEQQPTPKQEHSAWPRRGRLEDPVVPPSNPAPVTLGAVLQSASVIGRLAPANGCLYVTAIDPSRMKVVAPARQSTTLNWDAFQKEIEKADQNMIDARVLQNKKGPGTFLRDFFERLSSQNSGCDNGPANSHVIVVISPVLSLPQYENDMRLSAAAAERARFYFFKSPSGSPLPDDLGKILKPSRPKEFEYRNPEAFRKAVASFLSDLRSGH